MPINMKNLRRKPKTEEQIVTKHISYRELADMIKSKKFPEAQGIIHSVYDIPKLHSIHEFNTVLRKFEKNLNDADIMLTPLVAVELIVQKSQLDYGYQFVNTPFSVMSKIKYGELSERFLAVECLDYTIR